MLTQKLWSLAQIGAEWVLYLLIILSIISIAVMVERAIYFWRARFDMDHARHQLRRYLKSNSSILALKHFRQQSGVPAAILSESLEVAGDGADAVEERAAGARGQHRLTLERGLVFLGTLGNNAPFIGLFGTVLGIINAFRELSHSQLQLASSKIMAGISEALVATAVGLLVALPAVVAYNFFQRKVKEVLAQSDVLVHDLLAHLRGDGTADVNFAAPEIVPRNTIPSSVSMDGIPAASRKQSRNFL